jgi:plastocyanin
VNALKQATQCTAGAVLALAALLTGASSALRAEPATHQIVAEAFAFKPARLVVHQGDVIEWTNRDIVSHTAAALDGSWTTGEILPHKTGRITASAAGTFDYHCTFHPLMRATIVVEAAGQR